MECPRCGGNTHVKSGFKDGRQRYRCSRCRYHYSKESRWRYSKEIRECALRMVAEGMGFRQVERALGPSHVTVMQWARKYGTALLKRAQVAAKEQEFALVEIDELCTFIGQKKDVPGYGYLLIEIRDASLPSNLAAVIKAP